MAAKLRWHPMPIYAESVSVRERDSMAHNLLDQGCGDFVATGDRILINTGDTIADCVITREVILGR